MSLTENLTSRYPYTYACDLIRAWAGYNEQGTKLSRSDASQIRSNIAEILGVDDEELAKKLADFYVANRDEIGKRSTEEFLRIKGWKLPGV